MQLNMVRRKDARCNNQGGFTLIEVLMAMAIFLIGILAVLIMQIRAINTNSGARSVTENYTWAMDKVEELLGLPYDDPNLNLGTFAPASDADSIDNNCNGQIDEAGENGAIDITWVVQAGPVAGTKWVQVTVTQSVPLSGDKVVNVDFIKANM